MALLVWSMIFLRKVGAIHELPAIYSVGAIHELPLLNELPLLYLSIYFSVSSVSSAVNLKKLDRVFTVGLFGNEYCEKSSSPSVAFGSFTGIFR